MYCNSLFQLFLTEQYLKGIRQGWALSIRAAGSLGLKVVPRNGDVVVNLLTVSVLRGGSLWIGSTHWKASKMLRKLQGSLERKCLCKSRPAPARPA